MGWIGLGWGWFCFWVGRNEENKLQFIGKNKRWVRLGRVGFCFVLVLVFGLGWVVGLIIG